MALALKELRADLVEQAEEAVKVNASSAAQDLNIRCPRPEHTEVDRQED